MTSFREELARYVSDFFTNWRESDLPFIPKVALTVRNRARSLVKGGCCGNTGQPGC